jgi:hypothetical protein
MQTEPQSRHPRTPEAIAILLARRGVYVELVVVAVVLGVAVNLCAAGVQAALPTGPKWLFILAAVLGGGSLFWSLRWLLSGLRRGITVDGFLACDSEMKRVIPVFRHALSESVANSLDAVCFEDPALKEQWRDGRKRTKDAPIAPPERLAREAIEAFALMKLASNLKSSVRSGAMKADQVVTLQRNSMGDLLLNNRVLNLITAPLEDRHCFREVPPLPPGERVVRLEHPDGTIFDDFQLVLPRGSAVSKPSPEVVRVTTSMFTMDVRCETPFHRFPLPHWFETFYLKSEGVITLAVKIEITVQFRLRSLLSVVGWSQFEWLDAFLRDLDDSANTERFFDQIGWDHTVSLLRAAQLENRKGSPWDTRPKRDGFAAIVEFTNPQGQLLYKIRHIKPEGPTATAPAQRAT